MSSCRRLPALVALALAALACCVAADSGLRQYVCSKHEVGQMLSGKHDQKHCDFPVFQPGCRPGFFQTFNPLLPASNQSYPAPDGFYSPRGWVCLIPCSKGALCLHAFFNSTSNKCGPYNYVPQNGACGGADHDYYCPEGSYCPHADKPQFICQDGFFCRPGSYRMDPCPVLTFCPAGTGYPTKNLLGALTVVLLFFFLFASYRVINGIVELRRTLRERRRQRALPVEDCCVKLCLGSAKKTSRLSMAAPASDGEESEMMLRAVSSDSSAVLSTLRGLRPKEFTVDFAFDKLGLVLRSNGLAVLNGVTGRIRSGRVTAIMGPSGAGKTTFLSTLSNKATYGEQRGDIYINGALDNIQRYKKVLGFVPQEDTMLRELSVKEILLFYARLRLPKHFTTKQVHTIVNDVITVLGLQDVRHMAIGDEEKRGISGGQRKRVNIGMELVADPTVLLLDEPTSGLDSTSSFEVLQALRAVSGLGITVITVLHQPRYEIFQMFHEVLLLGKGGRTVYLGETERALPYFEGLGFQCPERTNPADFFMDVISGVIPRHGQPDFVKEHLFTLWEEHARENGMAVGPEEGFRNRFGEMLPPYKERITPGFFSQLLSFTRRGLRQQLRTPNVVLVDLILTCLSGGLLGALFVSETLKEVPSLDLLAALAVGLTTMTSTLRTFGGERVVYWREAAMGINKFAYFLGKNLSDVPKLLIMPILFLSIFYSLSSPAQTFLRYYATVLAGVYATSGIGYLISLLLSPKNAQVGGVTIILVLAMFGGTNPTIPKMNQMGALGKLAYTISFARWFQEAIFIGETNRYPPVYDTQISGMMHTFGYDKHNYGYDIVMLGVIGTLTRLASYLALAYTNRDKQV